MLSLVYFFKGEREFWNKFRKSFEGRKKRLRKLIKYAWFKWRFLIYIPLRSRSIFGNEESKWFIESSLNRLKYALLSPMLMENTLKPVCSLPFLPGPSLLIAQQLQLQTILKHLCIFFSFLTQEATGRLSCFCNNLEKCYDQQQIPLVITHLPSLLYAFFFNWPQLLLLQEHCVTLGVFVSSER